MSSVSSTKRDWRAASRNFDRSVSSKDNEGSMKLNILAGALAAAALAGVTLAAQGSAQSPPPESQQPAVTFRAEVNYVEVDARVTDADGNFVSDLSAADFVVLEDGQAQKVSVFSEVNIPVERQTRPLFANRAFEPDVQTNASGITGRVYLIVLDDLHTTALLTPRTRLAAREFVERYMGANDVAAVVHTSGRADASQEFTNNPRLLIAAIDKFQGRKLRSALLNRLDQEQMTRGARQPGAPIDDIDATERGFNARNTLESLGNFAGVLENVRGRRKALVYFSEGIDYNIYDPFSNRDATTIIDETRAAIAAATRANVALYGVDVRGLGAGAETAIEVQSFPGDPTLGLDSTALANEVRLGQDSLRVLSEETGGFAVVNTNDVAGAFERLVEENSSYYVLGYYPSNDRRDGRFRKIDVRVNKPGLTVRARRGYVAPRGRAAAAKLAGPNDASEELREAMSSPVPVAGLPLAATASVFKGPDGKGAVVISTTIGARDLSLVEKNGTFNNNLEFAWLAVDHRGKLFPGDRNTLDLNLRPETLKRLRAGGFRIISTLELPPGRYQLRLAAREANTRRSGSLNYDIEVPDFGKERLSMSGLALTSVASSLVPTARPTDPLAKLLPGPMSTHRDFVQGDEIALFAEVYESNAGPAHKVNINLTLKAEGGQTVYQTREERDSSELAGSSGGYGFAKRIPLRDIAPGLYVLRVEAQSQIGERPTVARETIVTVIAAPGATGAPSSAPSASSVAPSAPSAPGVAPSAPIAAPSARDAVVAQVQMQTVNADIMSAVDRPEQVVARNDNEWQALWRRHAPGRPAPAVDFTKNMVIAVFLGSRPSGGYQVQIVGVRSAGATLVVQWSEQRPGPGQVAAQVMTAPAHIVSVPRHAGEVRFEQVGQ
jgi:VWFA-related protein